MGLQTPTPTMCTGCGIDALIEAIEPSELFCPDCNDCLECCEENHENDFPGRYMGRCYNGDLGAWREARAVA